MPSPFKIPFLDGDPEAEQQQQPVQAPVDPNAIPPLEQLQQGAQGLPELGMDQDRPRVISDQQAHAERRIGEIEARKDQLKAPHLGQPNSRMPGTGGKILHGLATAGNILGDIFAPNVMARIPGTQLHNDIEKKELEKEEEGINQVGTKNAADSSQLQSENTQRAANTDYLKAETETKLHPPESQHDLAIAYGHRVKQVLAEGGDPATDPTTMKLQDAITGLQKQTAPTTKGFQHLNLKDPKTGGPMGANYDPNQGKFYDTLGNEIANPVPYEKPQQAPVFQMLTPTPTGDYQLKNFHPNQVIPQGAISKTGLNTIDTPTSQMRNTAARAELVHESVPEILQNVDANSKALGPVMGNWNAFMQGKVGMDNPNFAQLRMDLLLFSSAVALAHAQGRLPENLREEFDHAINAPKQTPENLKAIIHKVDNSMVRTVGAMGGAPNSMRGPQAAPAAGAANPNVKRFNPVTGRLE